MTQSLLRESMLPASAAAGSAGAAVPAGSANGRSAATAQQTFADLGVPAPLVAALAADGKVTPFPIQASTLADTLAGRDVLGRGKTGSGKTLAFCLPLAARLGASGSKPARQGRTGHPRGLILAPTRELATQIEAVLKPLAAAYGLATTTIFGGVKQTRQVAALQRGVDIVVACPGRLEDLMQQGFISLADVQITVLDEADHMADLGFLPVVTRILRKTPEVGQRMLFSATLDRGVDKIVRRFLSDPTQHSVDSENSPVAAMTHYVFAVDSPATKNDLVAVLARGMGKCILFMRTKHQAKKLAKKLIAAGIPAVDLHGNLSQSRRDTNLAAFSSGAVRVLVATDVAARGVHVDDVELVVHVDPPAEHKAYLHRSGRTARAGSAGSVVTICLPEQRHDVAALLRKAKINVKPMQVTASSPAVTKLAGELAPLVTPEPAPAASAQRSGGSRRRSGGAGGARGRSRGGSGRSRDDSRDGSGSRDGGRDSGGNNGGTRDDRYDRSGGNAHGGGARGDTRGGRGADGHRRGGNRTAPSRRGNAVSSGNRSNRSRGRRG